MHELTSSRLHNFQGKMCHLLDLRNPNPLYREETLMEMITSMMGDHQEETEKMINNIETLIMAMVIKAVHHMNLIIHSFQVPFLTWEIILIKEMKVHFSMYSRNFSLQLKTITGIGM